MTGVQSKMELLKNNTKIVQLYRKKTKEFRKITKQLVYSKIHGCKPVNAILKNGLLNCKSRNTKICIIEGC